MNTRKRSVDVERAKDTLLCAIVEQFDDERLRQGLTVAEMARASGVAKSCVIRQRKALSNPTLETIVAQADALGGRVELTFIPNQSSDEPAE